MLAVSHTFDPSNVRILKERKVEIGGDEFA